MVESSRLGWPLTSCATDPFLLLTSTSTVSHYSRLTGVIRSALSAVPGKTTFQQFEIARRNKSARRSILKTSKSIFESHFAAAAWLSTPVACGPLPPSIYLYIIQFHPFSVFRYVLIFLFVVFQSC